MGSIQEASKESYAETYSPEKRRKHQVSNKLDESEESSGYIVDYEQMLKDSKLLPNYGGLPKGGFRENDIGQQPILEQTQANETSNESTEKSPKFVDSQRIDLNLNNKQAALKHKS